MSSLFVYIAAGSILTEVNNVLFNWRGGFFLIVRHRGRNCMLDYNVSLMRKGPNSLTFHKNVVIFMYSII